MAIFAIASGIIGMLLGWRFTVMALIPCILGTVAILAVYEVVYHQGAKTAVITLALSLGLQQVGYLLGRVLKTALRAYSLPETRVQRRGWPRLT